MSLKDLVKGRTPRDPQSPNTWIASFLQGGGAGIYGDFLFGEMRNRFGRGVLPTIAGPTLGKFSDLADLFGRIKAGDPIAAKFFRTVHSSIPFANVFYAKLALDYLIMWQIQETLTPGAMKRMVKRAEEENAQRFLVSPTNAVK